MRIEDVARGMEVAIVTGPWAGSHGKVTRVGPPVTIRFADGANGGPMRLNCPPDILAPLDEFRVTRSRAHGH